MVSGSEAIYFKSRFIEHFSRSHSCIKESARLARAISKATAPDTFRNPTSLARSDERPAGQCFSDDYAKGINQSRILISLEERESKACIQNQNRALMGPSCLEIS